MSQNQFPGQGPQYPQGGQQVPQGGQQVPQGGQQFPQGGQQFPSGQQFPGQQFPPGQQSQGGQQYPQGSQQFPPGQYPPAGAPFPAAGGQYGGQQPRAAAPGYPAGFSPQPPKPKGRGTVIGIVVAALAAVALLGWLLMSLFGARDPGPAPTPSPSPVQTTAEPSPTPSATPSTDPSTGPSPSASPTTPGGSADVGLGVSVTPADGWRQSSRNELKNYTELTNGDALLVTQAFRVEGTVTGKQIVTSYQEQITGTMTGVSKKEPADLDVKNARLSAGIASWSGTRATSQGSVKLSYLSIISVREDGLAVMSTLIVPSGVTLASQQTDYLAMTNSLLSSQLRA